MIVLFKVDFLIVIYFNLYTVGSENTNYINLLPTNKLKIVLKQTYSTSLTENIHSKYTSNMEYILRRVCLHCLRRVILSVLLSIEGSKLTLYKWTS